MHKITPTLFHGSIEEGEVNETLLISFEMTYFICEMQS